MLNLIDYPPPKVDRVNENNKDNESGNESECESECDRECDRDNEN